MKKPVIVLCLAAVCFFAHQASASEFDNVKDLAGERKRDKQPKEEPAKEWGYGLSAHLIVNWPNDAKMAAFANDTFRGGRYERRPGFAGGLHIFAQPIDLVRLGAQVGGRHLRSNKVSGPTESPETANLTLAYIGFIPELVLGAFRVELSFGLLIGGCLGSYTEFDPWLEEPELHKPTLFEDRFFFLIEPQVALKIPIWGPLYLDVRGGYFLSERPFGLSEAVFTSPSLYDGKKGYPSEGGGAFEIHGFTLLTGVSFSVPPY